nr:tail protein X [Piscirickettsia litoralis]
MLDDIVFKVYGNRSGAMEAVLLANPQLSHYGPLLPALLNIELPDLPAQTTKTTVQLWD